MDFENNRQAVQEGWKYSRPASSFLTSFQPHCTMILFFLFLLLTCFATSNLFTPSNPVLNYYHPSLHFIIIFQSFSSICIESLCLKSIGLINLANSIKTVTSTWSFEKGFWVCTSNWWTKKSSGFFSLYPNAPNFMPCPLTDPCLAETSLALLLGQIVLQRVSSGSNTTAVNLLACPMENVLQEIMAEMVSQVARGTLGIKKYYNKVAIVSYLYTCDFRE